MAGELDHAAVGRDVAAQDRKAAGGLSGSSSGRTTRWPAVSLRLGGVLADRAPGDRLGVLVAARPLRCMRLSTSGTPPAS